MNGITGPNRGHSRGYSRVPEGLRSPMPGGPSGDARRTCVPLPGCCFLQTHALADLLRWLHLVLLSTHPSVKRRWADCSRWGQI